MPVINEGARKRFVTTLGDVLLHVIVRERGGQWAYAPAAAETPLSTPSGALGFTLLLRGQLSGQLRLEISEEDAQTLFSKREDLVEEQLQTAWLRLMENAVGCMPKRSADSKTFPFSIESHSLAEIKPRIPLGAIPLEGDGGARILVHLLGDSSLLDSLCMDQKTASCRNPEQPMDPQLDRVIDVPLPVTLRFGQRQMRLREVLGLNAGALVELDRKVEEPVDLILHEMVIAKGEVVIVDGNYGLRVTEILERNLLRSL